MRRDRRRGFQFGLVSIIGALSLAIGITNVAKSESYYEGKRIELIAATKPGGGTDLTARLIASNLPKYIPGKPVIVVKNNPGGGGSVALNSFYAKAKPDGKTLLIVASVAIGLQMEKARIVKYDLMNMPHIGSLSPGGSVIAIRKDALKRLRDPQAESVVCGSQQGTETWNAIPI